MPQAADEAFGSRRRPLVEDLHHSVFDELDVVVCADAVPEPVLSLWLDDDVDVWALVVPEPEPVELVDDVVEVVA
jgi:hypothetical protein